MLSNLYYANLAHPLLFKYVISPFCDVYSYEYCKQIQYCSKNINVYWVTSFEYKYKLYTYFSKKKPNKQKTLKSWYFERLSFLLVYNVTLYFIMERDDWINVFVPMVMIKVDDLSQWWWLGLMLCLLISKFYIIQYRNCFWWVFFICSSFSFKTLKLE